MLGADQKDRRFWEQECPGASNTPKYKITSAPHKDCYSPEISNLLPIGVLSCLVDRAKPEYLIMNTCCPCKAWDESRREKLPAFSAGAIW